MKKYSPVSKLDLLLVLFLFAVITISLYGNQFSVKPSLADSQNNLLAQNFPSNTVCGGSQYCVPSTSPALQPSNYPSIVPSVSVSGTSATVGPGLTQAPCTPVNYQSRYSRRRPHHHHKHGGGGGGGGNGAISGSIQQLLDMIIKLLNQLIALLGGTPIPSGPIPSGVPNPSVVIPNPTAGPGVTTTVPNPCPPSAAPTQPVPSLPANNAPSQAASPSGTQFAPPTTSGAPAVITYIAMGKVPVEGLQVGATFYGALATSTQYQISNLKQGGTQTGGAYNGYDDNGEGACGGVYADLTNKATWAENGSGGNINAGLLGNLPCGTKLAIDYNGHTIIAEKADISDGGCGSSSCAINGVVQMIDLWWQGSKALCFWNQPDVMTIHVVPSSTPTTVVPTYNASDPASIATCN